MGCVELCAQQSGTYQLRCHYLAQHRPAGGSIRFEAPGYMGDEDMVKAYIMPNRSKIESWGNIIGI